MSETFKIHAAYVELTSPDDGDNEWSVEQTEAAAELSVPDHAVKFDWSFGPFSMKGFLDRGTHGMTCAPVVGGIHVGIINGNLKDSVILKVNLHNFKGYLRWYLKNGNELWIRTDLKVTFNGSYFDDLKIFVL